MSAPVSIVCSIPASLALKMIPRGIASTARRSLLGPRRFSRQCSQIARPRLQLLTSKACSLCDDMKEVIEDVQENSPFELEMIDIRSETVDHQTRRAFQYDIPVLLSASGAVVAKHRLTREKLTDYLRTASGER